MKAEILFQLSTIDKFLYAKFFNNMNNDKFTLVIFGASGDLTWRKLIPALYSIYHQKLISSEFRILGVGRKKITDAEFRAKIAEGLPQFVAKNEYDTAEAQNFLPHISYQSLDTAVAADYIGLSARLQELSGEMSCNANYLYYFAVPPFIYSQIAYNLREANLTCNNGGWKRVIVEKPFGRDLESAQQLNTDLLNCFDESQIYRIDHYLGKETVQNILVTRFSNTVFEPLWNRNYIEYVEITSAESLGVGSRAGYYETAGALRDMLQNHLLQLLGIVAMEPPVAADSTSIRNEMVKVFQSLRPINSNEVAQYVIRGQYTASHIKGVPQIGYRDEEGVSPTSETETFVAMKCFVDNWRWSGVPFYIRTGKRLPTRVTEVVIHFKENPHRIFSHNKAIESDRNQLIIRIQPDEGLMLKFGMKVPGSGFRVERVNMDFRYSSLSDNHIPDAYERLLCDCMAGDATLFQRGDAVNLTWAYVQPVIDAWKENGKCPLFGYGAGSWGPEQSDKFIAGEGYAWRYPCKNLADDGHYCEL